MASIRAAETFCDLEPVSAGKAHFLQGTLAGCFAIDIAERRNTKRLICEPHRPYEKNKNGQFIKQSIQEIKILKIVDDYH
ncbi:MAG: hypothetical protein OYG31_00390 [Candidatus Kaiserbacteria bacterium]|nr:hypothetical protein [Candidatus Kaiserbacteria bacterium]